MNNDLINGLFEVVAGGLVWINVRRILKDKCVQGISWPVQGFFALWGWWNLYYYPTLDQWASFYGGAFLVVGNTTWVVIAITLVMKNKRRKGESPPVVLNE